MNNHTPSKISDHLKNTAATIQQNVEEMLESTRDWQTILKYVTNRTKGLTLTPKQAERLDRYQFIYNQMVTGKFTETEIVNMVKLKYDFKSSWQAYDDIKATKEIFNATINIVKQFELKVQLEINRSMLRKAAEVNNFDAYARIEKNRIALLAQIQDAEDTPGDTFQGHIFEPVFDPSLIGAPDVDINELIKTINATRKKKIKTELFVDIQHEELKNESTDPLQ